MSTRKKRALTKAEMAALDALVGKSKKGVLVTKDLVRAARRPSHPLHKRFDWNDSVAAAKWRMEQARDIIQIYVTVLNGGPPVHAMVSVAKVTGRDGYMPIRSALSSADTMAELRRMFARDLVSVLVQYEYLRKKLPAAFRLVERAAVSADGNGALAKLRPARGTQPTA